MMAPEQYKIFEELAYESCNFQSFGAELRSRIFSKELTLSGSQEQQMYEGLKSQLSPTRKKRRWEKGDDEAVAWMTTLEDYGGSGTGGGGYNTPPASHGAGSDTPASNGGVTSEVDEAADEAAGAADEAAGAAEGFVLPAE